MQELTAAGWGRNCKCWQTNSRQSLWHRPRATSFVSFRTRNHRCDPNRSGQLFMKYSSSTSPLRCLERSNTRAGFSFRLKQNLHSARFNTAPFLDFLPLAQAWTYVGAAAVEAGDGTAAGRAHGYPVPRCCLKSAAPTGQASPACTSGVKAGASTPSGCDSRRRHTAQGPRAAFGAPDTDRLGEVSERCPRYLAP